MRINTRQRRHVLFTHLVIWSLFGCTDPSRGGLDMGGTLSLENPDARGGERVGGAAPVAGELSGGDSAAGGSAGESLAGDPVGGHAGSLGGHFGLSPLSPSGGDVDMSRSELCGDVVCDAHAMCVSSVNGPRCECDPRYEGDGVDCAPISCPPNASGAPDCVCNEGYEGELTFELSDQAWMGFCRFLNPCQLITIRSASFLETEDPEVGSSLSVVCVEDESGVTRYRVSLNDGEVYLSEERSDAPCGAVIDENPELTPVNVWPYSGGVLIDAGLARVDGLTYSSGQCVYDVLTVKSDAAVELVYLTPTGRSCSSGEVHDIRCGVGACQVSGEVACEAGEWVERCEPTPPLTGPDSCDGLDSDCDDKIDEDFVAEETSCGVGACLETGALSCSQGIVRDSCEPRAPIGVDDSCDGIDQDCDGTADETYITQLVSCGAGVCQAEGATFCREGAEVTECSPEPPSGDDANCNLIDEDCDGVADEGYVGQPVRCGIGACLFDGFTRCVNGAAEEACTPLPPAADDATCDGVDDDCDGRVDENYISLNVSCGVGACSSSGVTACVDGEVSELCTPGDPLDDDRDCDLIDSDCDGRVDESFENTLTPCSGAGVYECAVRAPLRCENGAVSLDCESALEALNDETCDGLDDDCDGSLDEDYLSVEVTCGLGECVDTSMSRCIDGEVTDRCLIRAPTGDDSDCDGRDDDCDGQTDESFVERVVSCGEGVCASTGLLRCVEGEPQSECFPSAPVNPDERACDNVDDDCDGRVDEGFVSTRNDCGFGVCAAIGSSSCRDGVESMNCSPLPATGDDADCDGIDQDCDDRADESYPPHIDECGTGVCYNTAASSCVSGAVQNNCVPLPTQGDDSRCDGIDQDCDGRVDEAYQPVATTCTYGSVCVQDGLTACVNGQVIDVCDPPAFYTGSDNSCNNEDNDCDGDFDEGFVGGVYYCGNGVCRGSGFRSCVNGQEGGGNCTPNNNLASSDNNCNGSDDDCDGRTDEHYGSYNVTCGRGVCARSGVESCSGGSLVSTCVAGAPQGDDSDTNGRDDDCDGRVDEDACTFVSNVDGCNGGDDDCDGRVDEDFSSYNGACGQGVCASTGVVTCNNGAEVSSCSPNNNLSSADNNCDSVDDDCDGNSDEHYQGAFEPCGVGACKSNGFFICQNGSPTHDCTPGQPGAEVLGNGADDDCDGRVDEEPPPPPPSCGNVTWYIGPGRSALNEFCCVNADNCLSFSVYTRVKQPGNLPSSAFDEIVCKDGVPYDGRGSYHINSAGPYYYNGRGDFTYWQISPTGRVLDAGTWNCAGPGGGGSF